MVDEGPVADILVAQRQNGAGTQRVAGRQAAGDQSQVPADIEQPAPSIAATGQTGNRTDPGAVYEVAAPAVQYEQQPSFFNGSPERPAQEVSASGHPARTRYSAERSLQYVVEGRLPSSQAHPGDVCEYEAPVVQCWQQPT